ncbi:MAG: hypothetical protein HY722_11325 [Planctomycetes bacterium]|nr:hypothetical protein [Planctomycetota bacterium]
MDEGGRPLSPIEKALWRLSDGASMNFSLMARLRGPLSSGALRAALDAVQARHPLLRVRIASEGGGAGAPAFRPGGVPPLPLRELEGGEDSWVERMEEEIHRGFPWETGPLFRCVLLRHGAQDARVMLTCHHAVSDGLSAAKLMQELLRVAGEGARLPPLEDRGPVDARLPPQALGAAGLTLRLRFVLRELWRDRTLGRPAFRLDHDVPPHERRTRITPHRFDEAFTSALLERARRERVTVHGVAAAALLLAVARDAGAGQDATVGCASPVDLRPQLVPPAGEEVGFFVAMSKFRRRIRRDTDLWVLARAIREGLKRDMATRFPAATLPLVARLYRMAGGDGASPQELARRFAAATPNTTGLTHLGGLDALGRFGDLEVQEVQGAAALSALGRLAGATALFRGRLSYFLLWPEPSLDRSHAEALAGDIRRGLQESVTP